MLPVCRWIPGSAGWCWPGRSRPVSSSATVPPGSRIDWRLSPEDRLARLAPFADWSAPTARVINGQLIWLLDGYLASGTFPLTGRVTWRDRRVGSVRAAFLGTVNAETGATRVFLQPGADALAETWADCRSGVVEPGSAIPEAVLRAAPYPAELFRIQAQELEHTPWNAGSLEGAAGRAAAEPPPPQVGWGADTSGPQLVSTFEAPGERRLSAVLVGSRDDGRTHLQLVRLDSTTTLPIRAVLENRWANFPSYDALQRLDRVKTGRSWSRVRFEWTSGPADRWPIRPTSPRVRQAGWCWSGSASRPGIASAPVEPSRRHGATCSEPPFPLLREPRSPDAWKRPSDGWSWRTRRSRSVIGPSSAGHGARCAACWVYLSIRRGSKLARVPACGVAFAPRCWRSAATRWRARMSRPL